MDNSYCTNCGQPMQADANFCTRCGKPKSPAVREVPSALAEEEPAAIQSWDVKKGVSQYFPLMEKMNEARSQKRYTDALNLALEAVKWLPQEVKQSRREPGGWCVAGSPALGYACHYLGALRRRDDLVRIKTLLKSVRELREWTDEVDFALKDADLMDRIESVLQSNPGIVQANLGRMLNCDGRQASNVIHYAEQMGLVRREREGKSYRLYLK